MVQMIWLVLLLLSQVFGVDTSGIVGPLSTILQMFTGGSN